MKSEEGRENIFTTTKIQIETFKKNFQTIHLNYVYPTTHITEGQNCRKFHHSTISELFSACLLKEISNFYEERKDTKYLSFFIIFCISCCRIIL